MKFELWGHPGQSSGGRGGQGMHFPHLIILPDIFLWEGNILGSHMACLSHPSIRAVSWQCSLTPWTKIERISLNSRPFEPAFSGIVRIRCPAGGSTFSDLISDIFVRTLFEWANKIMLMSLGARDNFPPVEIVAKRLKILHLGGKLKILIFFATIFAVENCTTHLVCKLIVIY